MSDFLTTVLQLDEQEDLDGLLAFIQSQPQPPDALLNATIRLFTTNRLRFAYVLALLLTNSGHRDAIIATVRVIGGFTFGSQDERQQGLATLRTQTDTLSNTELEQLNTDTLIPLIWPVLNQAINTTQPNHPLVLCILEIFRITMPHFNTLFDPNAPVPSFSPEGLRAQAKATATWRHTPPPINTTQPRPRRALFAWGDATEKPGEPDDDLGVRIAASLTTYGWHLEMYPFNPFNHNDSYRSIPAILRQLDLELLLITLDPFNTPIKIRIVEMLAQLRQELPHVKVIGCLSAPWQFDAASLTEIAHLVDLLWEFSSPSLSIWNTPPFANKIVHALPGFSGSLGHCDTPLYFPLVCDGPIKDHHHFPNAFWRAFASQLNLPIHINWSQGLQATCYLNFSTHSQQATTLTPQGIDALLSGQLLIQEASPDLHYYLTPGEHYLEFSTLAELIGITRFMIEHPTIAEEIRQRGHAYACEHYNNAKLIGHLEQRLDLEQTNTHPASHQKQLIAVEYISANQWCRPVAPNELLTSSGNRIATFPNAMQEEPVIDVLGVRAMHAGYADLFPTNALFAGSYMSNFDYKTQKIITNDLFIARLENACVEYPAFGVLVDRHLLLAESLSEKNFTKEAATWFWSPKGAATRQVKQFELDDGPTPMSLDVEYYLDDPNEYQDENEAGILISGVGLNNYYHWMMDMLPRLWCRTALPELRTLPLIIRHPIAPYQWETLQALGIEPKQVKLFTKKMLRLKTLIFPSYLSPKNLSIRNVSWLRENLLPAFGITPQPPHKLIYISRSQASTRRLLNEPAVLDKLQPLGFEVLHLETMKVKEQIEAFSNARIVVMPHGAAGLNLIFAQPGTIIIDLMSASYRQTFLLLLASLNQCKYGILLCDDSNNPSRDMMVQIDKLLKIVHTALSQQS